jgi:hypothetical protein
MLLMADGKIEKQGIIVPNSYGPYNKAESGEQWIRMSEGCPNGCSFCYEPKEQKFFGIPEITRNKVKIMDMNLLSKTNAEDVITELGKRRVCGKVVNYELVCGIDWRFLTLNLAASLRSSRFKKIRLAWDFGYNQQFKIKKAIEMLLKVGYNSKDIMVFMICNWETTYAENLKKLDLCKVWRVRVGDCWFDGQTSPNIKPLGWTAEQIKDFRAKVRKHNQLVLFGIDPELKAK